ncbi:putative ankyrin repeat protein RF_0381 [Daphnia carinata]|uniref:putative ankyrin repeat protein RF_0381 n=1 Tax=Daphnia carinata TaxID=120202 RepID=UPI0028696B21|nr:putative ankyrin repeat protein RF_0381 [Daphnia carinata]XP_059351685.1 putative ankyrin repeat protein RF_0381 [Daphnia carinata]
MEESTALHFALETRSITATRHLLRHPDINLNIKNKKHLLPRDFATEWHGMPTHLRNAVRKKTTDFNAKEQNDENAPLHLAFKTEIEITAQQLRHENVDDNIEDNKNRTATHVTDGDNELQRLNAPSDSERPVEHDASFEIDSELHGNDSNDQFETTFEDEPNERLASQQGLIQLEPKNNTFGEKESELLQLCASYHSTDLIARIQTLMDLGTDVNATDKYGRNALHFLCRNNSGPHLIDAILLLIQHGINVNAASKFEQNALHYLCRKRSGPNLNAIQILIQSGFNVNAKDNAGWTALHCLCVYNSTSHLIDAIKLLIEHGIDVNAKSTIGWTALHYLCHYNSCSNLIGTVNILIQHGINVISDGHDARSILSKHYRKSDKDEIIKLMDKAVLAQS